MHSGKSFASSAIFAVKIFPKHSRGRLCPTSLANPISAISVICGKGFWRLGKYPRASANIRGKDFPCGPPRPLWWRLIKASVLLLLLHPFQLGLRGHLFQQAHRTGLLGILKKLHGFTGSALACLVLCGIKSRFAFFCRISGRSAQQILRLDLSQEQVHQWSRPCFQVEAASVFLELVSIAFVVVALLRRVGRCSAPG